MDDCDDLMIVGAKKKTNVKNYDKNEVSDCRDSFLKLILQPEKLNKEKFMELCMNGEIDKNFIRPTVWKMFLDVLPADKPIEDWILIINKQRQAYKNKMKSLNTLKKFSGDPLGGSSDSSWNTFFEDNELKKIINLDVNRTYQDKELFQTIPIKDMMFNVLFIWSKENKDVSYRQGMNEILAVLLYAIYPFYFVQNNMKHSSEDILKFYKTDKVKFSNEIYHYFHNQEELQSDLFFLFDSIMTRGIKDLFDSGILKRGDAPSFKKQDLFQPQWTDEDETDKDQLPLQKRCYLIIKQKLKLVDEELFNHFLKIDLNCSIFLQRWLKCIFNREFHPRDVFILWDAILANDHFVHPINEEKNSLVFIDYIAVAMINYIREDLLRKDQNDCFQRMFKYPPIETPMILVKLAIQLRDLIFKKIKKTDVKTNNISAKTKSSDNTISNFLKTNNSFKLKETNSNSVNTVSKKEEIKKIETDKNVVVNNQNNLSKLSSSSSLDNNLVIKNKETPNSDINADFQANVNANVNTNSNTFSQTEDENSQILNRLEEIYKKYKTRFDETDATDFEIILETLKNNLLSEN